MLPFELSETSTPMTLLEMCCFLRPKAELLALWCFLGAKAGLLAMWCFLRAKAEL